MYEMELFKQFFLGSTVLALIGSKESSNKNVIDYRFRPHMIPFFKSLAKLLVILKFYILLDKFWLAYFLCLL